MMKGGGGGGVISSLFGEKGGYLLFLKGQGFLPISFLEGYLFFLKGQGISPTSTNLRKVICLYCYIIIFLRKRITKTP